MIVAHTATAYLELVAQDPVLYPAQQAGPVLANDVILHKLLTACMEMGAAFSGNGCEVGILVILDVPGKALEIPDLIPLECRHLAPHSTCHGSPGHSYSKSRVL